MPVFIAGVPAGQTRRAGSRTAVALPTLAGAPSSAPAHPQTSRGVCISSWTPAPCWAEGAGPHADGLALGPTWAVRSSPASHPCPPCPSRVSVPVWERLLQRAPLLRRARLFLQLQSRRRGENQKRKPSSCGREDPEDLSPAGAQTPDHLQSAHGLRLLPGRGLRAAEPA